MNTSERLFINEYEINILFLDELTETIEVKYLYFDKTEYVTKSSINNYPINKISFRLNEYLIMNLGR
ncbi:MAG: hypothetical protein N4A40_06995 [Tissierellales bacterium]|nr:hypothetical protein [Tissierellales bacterium]